MKDYFKYCNAFVILTREGVVLTSDDTRITPEEDRYLQNLNRRLSERKYKRGKGSMTLDIKALREQLNKTRRDIDRNVYLIKSAEIANVGNVKQWLSEMGIRTVEPLLTEQIVISGRKRGGIFINESRLCSLILSSWTLINLATKQRRV